MELTKSEAESFVSGTLGLGPLVHDGDRLKLLNEIVKAYHTTPFTNVDLARLDEGERGLPTWEEMKKNVMERRGGLCYTTIVFMKVLLDALGYETFYVACDVFVHENHIAVMVRNLTMPGSLHLVDYNGYPCFEAIPIDFQEESPIYTHSYLEYKFVRMDDILLLRFHRKGENRPIAPGKELERDGWRRIVEINMTPRDISYFDKPMHTTYTTPGVSPFLTSFRAVVHRPKDLKVVAIKNKTLLLEQSDHTLLVEKTLETKEDMMAAVQEYFPQFDTSNVLTALEKLKLYQK